MQFPQPISVKKIAKDFNATLIGNTEQLATGINEVHHVQAGDITFVDVEKYYKKALQSAATIIIINKAVEAPEGKTLLLLDDPFSAYNQIVWQHRPFQPLNAAISPSATIGAGTIIEPGAIIGHHVTIGKDCYIQGNTYVGNNAVLGDHVTLQAGVKIGTDAFYFKRTKEGLTKWRSAGKVVLHDHVDIGANSTVNNGVSSDTIIGEGTKLDCLVQIGHDTKIGKHCIIAANAAIAGNCTIEDEVTIYGQAGVIQNIHIGKGAVVLGRSGVNKNLEGGKTYYGSPAKDTRTAYREVAALSKLPDVLRDLKK